MRRHHRTLQPNEFSDEIESKQKNLLWPDSLVNSRGVDELLFKGLPNPTKVQRVGAWIFGLAYISIGLGFLAIAMNMEQNAWVMWVLATAWWSIGIWICYNGSRKRRISAKKGTRPEPH